VQPLSTSTNVSISIVKGYTQSPIPLRQVPLRSRQPPGRPGCSSALSAWQISSKSTTSNLLCKFGQVSSVLLGTVSPSEPPDGRPGFRSSFSNWGPVGLYLKPNAIPAVLKLPKTRPNVSRAGLTQYQSEFRSNAITANIGSWADPNSVRSYTRPLGRYTERISGWHRCHPLRIGLRSVGLGCLQYPTQVQPFKVGLVVGSPDVMGEVLIRLRWGNFPLQGETGKTQIEFKVNCFLSHFTAMAPAAWHTARGRQLASRSGRTAVRDILVAESERTAAGDCQDVSRVLRADRPLGCNSRQYSSLDIDIVA